VFNRNDGGSSTTEEELAKLKEYCKEKYLLGRGIGSFNRRWYKRADSRNP